MTRFANIFIYVKAAPFFNHLAPGIKSWIWKLRGTDGRGNPREFTPEDLEKIRIGFDLLKKKLDM